MRKSTGFYKFVSICYFLLATLFAICFAGVSLAWILLVVASGLIEGGLSLVINGGCLMMLAIIMGILMLHIHGGCILWDLEKRDTVVYTIQQVTSVLMLFTKICIGMAAQYVIKGHLFLWILYYIFMITTSILGIVAFSKIKKETACNKTKEELEAQANPQNREMPENPNMQDFRENYVRLNSRREIGLQAIEGDYAGEYFPMRLQEQIVLGTNPNISNILFHDSKISRKHCVIRFVPKEQMYYIIDYSTNGTFLMDGTRLPVNVSYPCAPKTRFYFGSQHQVFELV